MRVLDVSTSTLKITLTTVGSSPDEVLSDVVTGPPLDKRPPLVDGRPGRRRILSFTSPPVIDVFTSLLS